MAAASAIPHRSSVSGRLYPGHFRTGFNLSPWAEGILVPVKVNKDPYSDRAVTGQDYR